VDNFSDSAISVLVKNTGTNTLPAEPGKMDVLVDGRYVSMSSQTIFVLDETKWKTGTVIRLEIDESLDAGEHKVVLVINGDREVFTFFV